MASNFYTKFATGTVNSTPDVDIALADRINLNSVAYSDILNGLLRQVTNATYEVAEFVMNNTDADVGSEAGEFEFSLAMENWIADKGFALDSTVPFEKAVLPAGQPSKLKVWYGPEAAYDAIDPKSSDTLYFIY